MNLCERLSAVIPAKAGIQAYPLVSLGKHWIPAFAGMTAVKGRTWLPEQSNLKVSAALPWTHDPMGQSSPFGGWFRSNVAILLRPVLLL